MRHYAIAFYTSVALVVILLIVAFSARGHETHLTYPVTDIIGEKYMGGGITVWYQDLNKDNTADRVIVIAYIRADKDHPKTTLHVVWEGTPDEFKAWIKRITGEN
jgi:hypothetical protein